MLDELERAIRAREAVRERARMKVDEQVELEYASEPPLVATKAREGLPVQDV